jgi:hypothetical protein
VSVPTNLIPTTITGLPEYQGSETYGFMPYIIDGRTYKVQFSNIAAVGAVPSSRTIATGTGLIGGGNLSADRTIAIANGGVGTAQLAPSGVSAGVYGSDTAIPILTVDVTGRVTAASTAPITLSGFVPTSRSVLAGTGLTGGGTLANDVTLNINFSNSTPQALGAATAGVSTAAARGDHVHPAVNLSDTGQTQGALPLGRGGTGDALSPVAGAVVYSTGTKFALTNPGLEGQVLVSNGTDEPQWRTITGAGTVTSVNVSGGSTGLSFTGGPITVSGTITMGGVLDLDNGGTGAINASDARFNLGAAASGEITSSGLTMATARLLGRTTASTGAIEQITIGAGLSLSGGSLANTAPDQVVSLTGGTAISISGSYPAFTINNTAPDQVVSLTASTGMSVTGTYPSFTLTNTAPDRIVSLATGTGISVSGTYPSFTITNSAPDQVVSLTAGTGISISGTYPSFTVTNSAPNQVVSLTGAGTTVVSGTYPNFTITSNDQFAGTVTSVAASGGTTGLTFTGSPITSSGTLTLGGTLAVANGGTGAVNAGAARANLSAAASGANTDITSIALTSGTITAAPTSGTDIVNKTYADSIASGVNFHQAVRLATTAALPANTYNNGASGVGATLTANANGALSIDGTAAVAGNRVLVKNEAAQANNGVYTVTQVGSGSTPYILTRATDFDSAGTGVDQIDAGDFFLVTAGSTQANTSWVQQTPLPITVGTTALVFTQFGAPITYSAGTGLSLAGTVFSIANTGVAASTYGSASSVPVVAVNAQGQITSASNSSIAIGASQVTSGLLAVAVGGTNSNATPTAGAVAYGTGSAYAFTTAGTAGQVLVSNGAGAPTYGSVNGGTF